MRCSSICARGQHVRISLRVPYTAQNVWSLAFLAFSALVPPCWDHASLQLCQNPKARGHAYGKRFRMLDFLILLLPPPFPLDRFFESPLGGNFELNLLSRTLIAFLPPRSIVPSVLCSPDSPLEESLIPSISAWSRCFPFSPDPRSGPCRVCPMLRSTSLGGGAAGLTL